MLKVNYASVLSTNELRIDQNLDAKFLCDLRSEVVLVINSVSDNWTVLVSYPSRNILGERKSVAVSVLTTDDINTVMTKARKAVEKQIQEDEMKGSANDTEAHW